MKMNRTNTAGRILALLLTALMVRSEERRVGKEC